MRNFIFSSVLCGVALLFSGCSNTATDENGNILELDAEGKPIFKPDPNAFKEYKSSGSTTKMGPGINGYDRLSEMHSYSYKKGAYADGRTFDEHVIADIPKTSMILRPVFANSDRIGDYLKSRVSDDARKTLLKVAEYVNEDGYEYIPTLGVVDGIQRRIHTVPTFNVDASKEAVRKVYDRTLRAVVQKDEAGEFIGSISLSPVWLDDEDKQEASLEMYQVMYDAALDWMQKKDWIQVTLFATSKVEAEMMEKIIEKNAPASSSAAGIMGASKVARKPKDSVQLHNEFGTSVSMSSLLQVNGLARSLGKVNQYASAMVWSLGKYDLGFGGEVALENRQQLHKAIYALGTCDLTPAMKLQGAVSYVSEYVTSKVFRNVSWEQQGVMGEVSLYTAPQTQAGSGVSFEVGMRAHCSKAWTYVPFCEVGLNLDGAVLSGAVSSQNFAVSFSVEQ